MSKSYRAILPPLSDEELHRLQTWSHEHCATSVLFRDGGQQGTDCVVWLATRERPRPRHAFMRSVRATLKKLKIDPSRLRGTWLVLASDDVVLRESRATRGGFVDGPPPSDPVSPPWSRLPPKKPSPSPPELIEDGDVKVIQLSGNARSKGACSGFRVLKV